VLALRCTRLSAIRPCRRALLLQVCCGVLLCVLQCVAVYCGVMYTFICDQAVSPGITVAGVLQCVAVCCSVLQCNALIHDQAMA